MNRMPWSELRNVLAVGQTVVGTIVGHEPYGALVDMGFGYAGLIQITDFRDEGVMTPEQYPSLGSEVRARVLGFRDRGEQVWLGMRPSQMLAG